jgi:carboxylesterase type B
MQSVTVVGHRAGASLVTALTAMPKRRGAPIQRLFHQVSKNFQHNSIILGLAQKFANKSGIEN